MTIIEALKWCSDQRAYVFFRTQAHGERGANKSRSVTVSVNYYGNKAEGMAMDLMDTRKPEDMLVEATKACMEQFKAVKAEADKKPRPVNPKPANFKPANPRQVRGRQERQPSNGIKLMDRSNIVVLPGEKLAKAQAASV